VLVEHYASIGLTALVGDPHTLNEVIGLFEVALGVLVFAWPATGVLVFVLAWKLATELLYVTAGAVGAGWEVTERAGAYAAPLALICVASLLRTSTVAPTVRPRAGTEPAPAGEPTSRADPARAEGPG
jgi:hypothetical protein